MMPAQLLNVTEAATRPAPPPDKFMAQLKQGLEAVTVESMDTAIFGDTFTDPTPQPDGSNQ